MIFPQRLQSPRQMAQEELPLYRDWAVDWQQGRMLRKNGRPYLVEGQEALKIWIYKALRTRPGIYVAYGPRFGMKPVRGLGNLEEASALLQQRITRALTRSPYIKRVSGFSFSREGDDLRAAFTVETVYGDMETEVTESA